MKIVTLEIEKYKNDILLETSINQYEMSDAQAKKFKIGKFTFTHEKVQNFETKEFAQLRTSEKCLSIN